MQAIPRSQLGSSHLLDHTVLRRLPAGARGRHQPSCMSLGGRFGLVPLARPARRPLCLVRATTTIERVAPATEKEVVGVVIVDRGTGGAASLDMLVQFASLYRQVTKRQVVEVAHLDAPAGPTLQEAVHGCVQRGCNRIIIVPYFLSSSRQATEEIPFLVADVQSQLPNVRCVITEPIGMDRLLVQFIENRVSAFDVGPPAVAERHWTGEPARVEDRGAAQQQQRPQRAIAGAVGQSRPAWQRPASAPQQTATAGTAGTASNVVPGPQQHHAASAASAASAAPAAGPAWASTQSVEDTQGPKASGAAQQQQQPAENVVEVVAEAEASAAVLEVEVEVEASSAVVMAEAEAEAVAAPAVMAAEAAPAADSVQSSRAAPAAAPAVAATQSVATSSSASPLMAGVLKGLGDSLLFATGAMAAMGQLSQVGLLATCITAATLSYASLLPQFSPSTKSQTAMLDIMVAILWTVVGYSFGHTIANGAYPQPGASTAAASVLPMLYELWVSTKRRDVSSKLRS